MNLITRLFPSAGMYKMRIAALPEMTQLSPREMYQVLDAYYNKNDLYSLLSEARYLNSRWTEPLKSLRNPAKRAVEFHVSHLWPGQLPDALPIAADNKRILEPIELIWRWSNWGTEKQTVARQFSKYGTMFIKVVQDEQSVYFQDIHPGYVVDFDTDHRGIVTYIRVDIPQTRRENDNTVPYTHTEIWDKDQGTYRVWQHKRGVGAGISELGLPVDSRYISDFGIDFVPFVMAKFFDVGEPRGAGVFTLEIDQIDELNRKATRYAQMIFRYNKTLWALRANMADASGRPLPAPRVSGDSDGTIELGDDRLMKLPGFSELQSLVPNINYTAHLDALNADIDEVKRDLPELLYYEVGDSGNISYPTILRMLAPAIDRVYEARGNAETALKRAQQMALTMGANARLTEFKNIGSYDAGDFEHSFEQRDVIRPSEFERAEIGKIYVEMGVPVKTVLRRSGWSEADLKEMDADKAEQDAAQQRTLASAVLDAQRRMDGGQQSNGLEQGQGNISQEIDQGTDNE